jgi:hypothetical protein
LRSRSADRQAWFSKDPPRLVASAPHGQWKTSTFLAGLRLDGIVAPCVFDGAVNGTNFPAWVEQFLVPTLRPGDIVVMDNLASHPGKVRNGAGRAIPNAKAE